MAKNHELKDGAAAQGELTPIWIRPKDVSRYFAIGRTRTYELISSGAIKSVSLKKRGQRHGTRLINVNSITAYLESLMTEE